MGTAAVTGEKAPRRIEDASRSLRNYLGISLPQPSLPVPVIKGNFIDAKVVQMPAVKKPPRPIVTTVNCGEPKRAEAHFRSVIGSPTGV